MRPVRFPVEHRRVTVIAIAAVILTIVATTLTMQGGPRPRPATGSATASPLVVDATPDPSPWVGGEIVAWAPTAELRPTDATGSVVPLTSGFRLTSLDGTSPAELARRLDVEPDLEMSVQPDGDAAVILTPAEPLLAGAVYRFSLRGAEGQVVDSWAFQADRPVRIVGSIPGDQATDVPVDTGIEIVFDQDGVIDAASHMTIEPPVEGRFEQHGRVLAFVPERLAPGTIYRVTVARGIGVDGTDETMADDFRFAFETAAGNRDEGEARFGFQTELIETTPRVAPVIGVWAFREDEDEGDPEPSVQIDVYRLSGLEAAMEAYRALRAAPEWSRWSGRSIDTAALSKVSSIKTNLRPGSGGTEVIVFPERLAAGWYVLEHPVGRRPAQAILQVTDIAGFLAVSMTRTVVWAHDLKTAGPLAGATITSDAGDMGQTDAKGLLFVDSPAPLVDAPSAADCVRLCDPLVVIRSAKRSAFLPLETHGKFELAGWGGSSDHWSVLHLDRNRYRPSDTINVWGVLRDRDTGDVPPAITLELRRSTFDDRPQPPVAAVDVVPSRSGVFAASVPLVQLPAGSYMLDVVVDGETIRGSWLEVGQIVKPAYRLEVETGRRVYVRNDRIRITARAAFFDGTPVPEVPLRIDGMVETNVRTDATGTAIHRATVELEDDFWSEERSVSVTPARAEEGEIAGASREFIVFPSRRTIEAEARIRAGRVRAVGRVNVLDVDRLEKEILEGGAPWGLDPRGTAVGGATVTVQFVELVPVKERVGTEYDFIAKRTVPVYSYDVLERDAGTRRVRTDRAGRFSAAIPASGDDHDYRVTVSVRDPDGLRSGAYAYTSATEWRDESPAERGLYQTTAPDPDFDGFSLGDTIDLTLRDASLGSDVKGATRYLFLVGQGGIREANVQRSPRYVATFEAWAAPNVFIGAVRFTGRGYVPIEWFQADLDTADRRLDLDLSVASDRYAPGDEVTLRVRTRNAAGEPTPATVVLQAIDEKLFAIGAASQSDPLPELYATVDSGLVGSYATHALPRDRSDGDTGGGDDDGRSDFRDVLLFRTVETGSDGRGTATFTLSDDLTSWRVVASAVTADLEAGTASIQVPVGLPFFVDATIAPEYLSGDRPTIQVRTFGAALAADDAVTISAASESLGFKLGPIAGEAFGTIDVPLPRLSNGVHSITITATTGSGSRQRSDRLTRSFLVVDTRLTRTQTRYSDLDGVQEPEVGTGLATFVLSDTGSGRYLELLAGLAATVSGRFDQAVAAEGAADLLRVYLRKDDELEPDGFRPDPYQGGDGGLALLPYASADLELSALTALFASDQVARASLAEYLGGPFGDEDETRERRMTALAGLAGLGEPVLPEIQSAAADAELTIREKLWIGLGAVALGDAATARSIGRALSDAYRESLGDRARLRVGETAQDSAAATAFMAILAAGIGDPDASAYWAYVEAHPSAADPRALPALGFVRWSLDRLPRRAASFAYTVDGSRTVVDLDPGAAYELQLTSSQVASLTFERLTGAIGVTSTWREPAGAAAFAPDPDLTIERVRRPTGAIGRGELLEVDLKVTFGARAPNGCHLVREVVPSGLVPVSSLADWINRDDEEEEAAPSSSTEIVSPFARDGQRLDFCAERGDGRAVFLRYYARVTTPGAYLWEPAIVESRTDPQRAAVTAETRLSIP